MEAIIFYGYIHNIKPKKIFNISSTSSFSCSSIVSPFFLLFGRSW